MTNYHINGNGNGDVGVCKAVNGYCPFSSFDYHFNSPEKAHELYENFMEGLANSKKSTRFYFVSSIERNAFTTRDCGHFAKYLNKTLNLPIYYVGDRESKSSSPQDRRWAHFVNRLPDGRFIDVDWLDFGAVNENVSLDQPNMNISNTVQ